MDTGALSELAVAKKLVEKGYVVSFPIFQKARYDLLADDGEDILRIQVKHGILKDGVAVFNAKSYCAFTKVNKSYSKDEIDFFGVYSSELDEAFLLPVEEISEGVTKGKLRVESPRNNQVKGVLFAQQYLI